MLELYPSPRPSDKQVKAMKCLCNDYSIPLPNIAKMTQGQVGKWIRETKERYENKKVVSKVTLTTYANGNVDVTHHRR